MQKYKINIHAHSLFSDGSNSPVKMAEEAKTLGFTALVLTDHFYGEGREDSLNKAKIGAYNLALHEAKTILPVIRGLEVPFCGEEVLVFGSSAIRHIIEIDGINNIRELLRIKHEYNCVFILCHPNHFYEDFAEHLDGYERHNGGTDYFRYRELGVLQNLQAWHNSDAHCVDGLKVGYNIINKKITTEDDLIKYIKRGNEHDYFVESDI